MNQKDFVAQKATLMRNGDKMRSGYCSAIYCDGETVYSYGRHYPLLYKIEKDGRVLLVANRKGYSMTTSKHIGYAMRHADVAVRSSSVVPTWEGVKEQLAHELQIDEDKYAALKRKDTKKAALMLSDIERLRTYLQRLV